MSDAQNIHAVTSNAPVADKPGIAYAASTQADPIAAAQAAASFQWGYQTAQTLRGLDWKLQAQAWSAFNEDERRLLGGMNYAPPHQGGISGFFKHVKEVALHPTQWLKALEPLAPLGAPLRAIQHAYRVADGFNLDANGNIPLKSLVSGHDWAEAWRKTSDGQKFLPHADRTLQDLGLGRDHWDIAIDSARGMSLEELIGKYGSEQVAAATTDPQWERALRGLDRSHISFGRDVAGLGVALTGGNRADDRFFGKVSGAIDAAVDVWADPLNIAAGEASNAYKARYLLKDGAASWDIVAQRAGVQRAMQRISSTLESIRAEGVDGKTGAGRIIRQFPELKPLAFSLGKYAKDGDITVEGLNNFFREQAGLDSWVQGNGSGKFLTAPRLGPLGAAKLDAFQGVKLLGDKLGGGLAVPDASAPYSKFAGRFLKGMTEHYRKTNRIDLASPKTSAELFDQVATLALPRAAREVHLDRYLAGDMAARHNAFVSMVNDVFHAAGSGWKEGQAPTTPFEAYHAEVLGLSRDATTRPYGIAPNGEVNSMVRGRSWAISEEEENVLRSIPDPAMMQQMARASGPLGTHGLGFVRAGMRLWKSGVLMRIGFPLRVGGEEAFRFILDEGPLAYLRANKAINVAKNADLMDYRKLGERLPGALGSTVDAAKIGETLGPWRDWLANRALAVADRYRALGAPINEALAGEWYLRAAEVAIRHHGPRIIPEEFGGEALTEAYRGKATNAKEMATKFRGKPLTSKMNGWGVEAPVSQEALDAWHRGLQKRMDSPTFQAAINAAEESSRLTRDIGSGVLVPEKVSPFTNAHDAVYDLMKSEDWALHRERLGILQELMHDGMSEDEAIRDLARRNTEYTFAQTHSPDGKPLPFLEGLRRGELPTVEELAAIPTEMLPRHVAVEKYVDVAVSRAQRLSAWWFHKSDNVIAHMAREPFYIHELATALEQVSGQVHALAETAGPKVAQAAGESWAMMRAFDRMRPMIHDPEYRNVFEQYHTGLLPFWFAQEQFIKRWVRTISRNPAAARRAQLLMMGLRHSGIVHKDDNGEDYFYMPMLPHMQEAIGSVASLLTGVPAAFNIDVPMTGSVKHLSAGTEHLTPSTGPLVGVAMELLSRRFGGWATRAQEAVAGDQGAGKPIWQQFLPSVVNNVVNSLVAPEASPQITSAAQGSVLQLFAIAQDIRKQAADAEAKGDIARATQLRAKAQAYAPDTSASPQDQAIFLQRVSAWSRGLLLLRAAYGFASPASPQLEFAAENTHPELIHLLKTLPTFEQALAEFIRRHPDEGYATVFKSKTAEQGKTPLSASEVAGQWLEKNRDFITKYGPSAATYFVPSPEGDQFDPATWKEELSMGLRIRKTTGEFWQDLQVAADKDAYYALRRQYYDARDKVEGHQRIAIDQAWGNYRDQFLNTRPLLKQYLNEGKDRPDQRGEVLDSLARARKAGDLPSPTAVQLIDGYRAFKDLYNSYRYRRDAEATGQRQALTTAFRAWGQSLTDPAASSIFSQLIEPDLTDEVTNGS